MRRAVTYAVVELSTNTAAAGSMSLSDSWARRSFASTATSSRWRNESSWLDSAGSTAPP